jgi:hypothetical protein
MDLIPDDAEFAVSKGSCLRLLSNPQFQANSMVYHPQRICGMSAQILEARSILGGKSHAELDLTTKLIPPSSTDDGDIVGSRIPNKYHIVRTFPIFPKDYADQGYRCYNKDGTWHVVLWPSANPDSRQDVQYLSDAVRLMIDEIQGDIYAKIEASQVQDVQKAKANAAHLMQLFEKRTSLLKVALDELTRQVSAHCTERGTLLAFIIDDLISNFEAIPKQHNAALKIQKREIDQLRVALDAKNLELESQAKDLNEQISLMQLERRMEKEWHGQLEDQLKKWKQQVDSYKKTAQDQIRLEREMLEHQISGLRDVVSDLRLENDALKEQLQFQRSELLKSEKKYAEFEQQIAAINKKNEKLQMQLSKGGAASARIQSPTTGEPPNPGPIKGLVDESKLKQLLVEFPVQRQMPTLSQREVTQAIFGLFEQLFNNPSAFAPFDDFYAYRLITIEETPQSAADTGRAFLESINGCCEVFTIAQIACDFVQRKYSEAVLRIFVQFFGFFKAQPFQGNLTLDHNTDIPSVPVVMASNLVTAMFGQFLGDDSVKDIIDGVKAVQVEERGREPTIPIVTVFDLVLQKLVDHFNRKCSEALTNFNRTYTRFQRTILGKIPTADSTQTRMDWRTFRDFMKPIRPELTNSELEHLFFESAHFSDSIASVTGDAFDTMCVSKQLCVNRIKPPGSVRRLRYVPPELLSVIDTAWKTSLRAAVKKAITELSKNDQSQGSVATLRALDQRLEDTIRNPLAGPLCVQLLHEAAGIIAAESVTIASSLPIDKCLAIMEKQLTVLCTDGPK